MFLRLVFAAPLALLACPAAAADRATIDALVAHHAAVHWVPEALVHRVIQRESSYNPGAISRNNFGLMQISHETARGMGYRGSASGLLDASTNLTYAVPYLANAYMVAGGNHDRAIAFYSRGYYYEAKRRGLLGQLRTGASMRETGAVAGAQALGASQESRANAPPLVPHGSVRQVRAVQPIHTVVQIRVHVQPPQVSVMQPVAPAVPFKLAQPDARRPAPAAPSLQGRVDLNTASVAELNNLGGGMIGRAIVAGRPYRSAEDLLVKRVLNRDTFTQIKGKIANR
jgi:hypothetical protein